MKNKDIETGLIFLVTWVLITIPNVAQSQNSQKPRQDKEPIEITSDRMRSEGGGVKIIFSGNVVSYKGDLKITSDVMELYNSPDKKKTDEIVAIGNVFITRERKRASGDRAVYLDKLQKIILTGTPKATAWEDGNMIEGREMIFLLDKDRFVVNERVRMRIYPKDQKIKKTQKKKPALTNKNQLSSPE